MKRDGRLSGVLHVLLHLAEFDGPVTSEVLARTFGRKHVLDPEALATIRAFFVSVGREMTENNARQAYFPEGAEVLPNPIGTAPGILLEVSETLLFCMPGVPRELMRMMDEQVMPRLAARAQPPS